MNLLGYCNKHGIAESFPRLWDEHGTLHAPVRSCTNHSHACGMNYQDMERAFPDAESFPRLWDEPIDEIKLSAEARIIPTPVG